MSITENNIVKLSAVVKAMAMATYEDYTKVKSSYTHFAARAWNDINRQYIGSKVLKAVLPVHKNFKTITIPACAKKILFVGLIDECGRKIPFTNNQSMTSLVEEIDEDVCESCNQETDICAQLSEMPPEETIVNIDGEDYINSVTKVFESGFYYKVKKTWVKSYVTNTVEEIISKELITEFELSECGCLAKTEENVNKVKEHCFDVYCACYAPCVENEYDLGSYSVHEELNLIQLERHYDLDKAYVEWRSALPRVNGELVLPENAFESVLQGGIYFATQHKKNIPYSEKQLNKENYRIAKSNMHIDNCRFDLSGVFHKIIKTPKFDIG